ncbi:MAG TPA: BON domain-containing protein [Planctomycetaceae bacterium]|nr:BON domain-containing protein [Planctomycetaceae bacterium]
MRKYGKWLLVLGVLATNPVASSADGFLGGRFRTPFSGAAQQDQNQAQADRVIAALKKAEIQGSGVSVEVQNGVATLDGKVFKASDRALAQRLASSVPGIESVENHLRFTPDARGQVQPASDTSFADSLDRRVTQAGHMKTADSGSGIRPVSGETVSFPAPGQPDPGQPAPVAQPSQTAFATNAAPSAPGNQAVAQQIAATLASVGLVGYDIEIRYNAGTATLVGDVATMQQRQVAGSAVSQIEGVRNVNNQLRVSGPVTPASFNQGPAPMAGPQQQYMPNQQQQLMPNQQQYMPAGYGQPGMQMDPSMMPSPTGYAPTSFNNPQLPAHAWPAYAQYPNSAAVTYPTQYSASAFPYIGPFYPYPQVPMGWREVSLEWDDGYWQLNFNKEKDKWYWILHPKNW